MNEHTSRRSVLWGAAVAGATALLPASVHAAQPADDSPSALRARWHRLLTGGPGLDLDDPLIVAAVGRVGRVGASAAKGLDPTRTDGLWPDLTSTTLSNHVSSSFRRLASLATAWAVPGTPQHADPAVARLLTDSLDWLLDRRYGPAHPRFDNDYDWEIGAALALNDTAVLLHGVLGTDRLARINTAVRHYTPDPNLWRADRQIATGANRVWVSTVVAVNAVLREDTAGLGRVRDALSDVEGGGTNSVLAFNDRTDSGSSGSGEGFYSDGSFLQHYKHPYNGGYGKEQLNNVSRLLHLLSGTPWRVTDPDLANVPRWVDEGFDPLMARGDLMASVCGREIARPSKQGHAATQTVIEAVLRLIPAFPGETADRFTSLAKQWITEDTYRDFLSVTDLASLLAAREVLASPVRARGPLLAHKQHPRMDKAAHHRPAFALGISAYSTRVYNYESIQNENLHGWHLSDGMLMLHTATDLAHYSEDYWPTVDPARLPGTTVVSGRPADAAGHRTTSTAAWAGGAALPGTTLGAYGMELRAYGSSLRALKSWFCLDDLIACVGSGISSPGTGAVETIIENRKLTDPRAALLVNGSPAPTAPGGPTALDGVRWLHLAGTGGYVFPRPARVHALREQRTATWREINLKYGTDTPVTRPYLTLWHGHGPSPTDAGYFHLQAPAASAGRTRLWSAAPPVRLVAATASVHAVRRLSDGLLAANFWAAGRAQELSADGPASVLLRTAGRTTTVALSDPTQLRDRVIIELAAPGMELTSTGPRVRAERVPGGLRITADTAGLHGATLHLALARTLSPTPSRS
ncbi:polysaccharide lyase 8 family protein [Streptomyces sp. NPDC054863]